MSTLLFTWNKSSYVKYPIYDSDPGKDIGKRVTNLTTRSVELSSPLNLETTLLITETTTSDDGITSYVQKTYLFQTINGNSTLGTVSFSVSCSQPASPDPFSLVPRLTSNLYGNGIFAEINGLQVIVDYDNTTGIRTVSVIPVN